jgi:oligopeptide transport system permease protein
LGRYLIRRTLISLVTIFGIVTATFFLLRCLPGGPFDAETDVAPQVLQSLQAHYGFDRPLLSQYFLFLKNLAHFDFGESVLYTGKPVREVIAMGLPRTFALGGCCLVLSGFFGTLLAFLYLLTGSNWIVRSVHFVFLSAPTLFLGPLFILVFGLWLNIVPITVGDSLLSYALPLAVLMVRPAANTARLLIGALEEALSQPWAVTAKAYGFSSRHILMKYAFKQSLVPALSYLGQSVAGILSGSLLVEMIFNIQGLGTEFVDSLVSRDYSLIISLTLLYGTLLVVTNFIFDVCIFSLDPRMEKN